MLRSQFKKSNFVFVIGVLFGDYDPKKKPTIEECQTVETNEINDLNEKRSQKGLEPVKYNQELKNVAQQEADRLSSLGKLELPTFNLPKNYAGYSYMINGKIDNKFTGSIMCHSNVYSQVYKKIYDIKKYDCDKELNLDLIKEVGFGRSRDKEDNLYVVKLYYTLQNSKVKNEK